MTTFPSALKSVFGSRIAEEAQSIPTFLKPWPLLKLVLPAGAARPAPRLQEMIESEIIPQLLRDHQNALATDDGPEDLVEPRCAESAQAFARMILSRDLDVFGAIVEKLRGRGFGPERLYSDLLAPAARLLVSLWDKDELSSTEVIIGLGRLQHFAHGLDSDCAYNGANDPSARSCLFSPRQGEQQTFGFYLIEELFRWSGWRTWIETAATDAEMVANVRCRWFDTLCLSVSRSNNIEDVATMIETVRRSSRNRDLFVIVNGRPFIERPELVETVGADAVASCGRDALHVADKAVWRLATT